LRLCLCELNLVGTRVDYEKEIAFMHDLPILEMDLGKRPTNLRTQLDPVDRRKLAEKANPRIDVPQDWLAHRYLGNRRLGRGGLGSFGVEKTKPNQDRERYNSRTYKPKPHF